MTGKRGNGEGSIYAYERGFRAYVWVTLPDGRRRRKYVSGRTREEVHAKWLKLHEAARRGPVPGGVPTVRQFLEQWMAEVVRPSSVAKTVDAYERCVRLYIVPGLGKKRLDRLTVSDVRLWLTKLRKTCQCCAQGKDKQREKPRCCAAGACCRQVLGDASVHQAWRVLRGALTSAVRDELVPRNVAALVRVPVPRRQRPSVWSGAEARSFLNCTRKNQDPMHAAYALMLLLGLRRGEVLGLAWEDVDLDKGQLRVGWQLQRVDGELRRLPVKTASSAAVLPLPGQCVEALRERLRVEERDRAAADGAYHESGLVFSTRLGMPLDPRNVHRAFKSAARRADVPDIPMHSLRRTCATLLVELGVHPRVAMQILRHSQIAVTMDIYSQVSGESTRDAVSKLGDAFDGV